MATSDVAASPKAGTNQPYLRIATEEAWATREQVDLYLKLLADRSSNDPGFESLWGHYAGGRSERVTQVANSSMIRNSGRSSRLPKR